MRVAVFTSGRHDWNILEPVVQAMHAAPGLDPLVIATGIHFRSGSCPETLGGFPIAENLDTLQVSDRPVAVAQTAGWTTALLAGCLERLKADALLVIGDRTETLAAGLAAICLRLPIIHIHGGEETEGAIDNLCRHALSKLASVHFVAHEAFASRLLQMGESPDRVIISGAPGLDMVRLCPVLTDQELAAGIGRNSLGRPLALFTYHSDTLGTLGQEIQEVLDALGVWLRERPSAMVILTRPNQDEGGMRIWEAIQAFGASHPDQAVLTEALGRVYYPMLRRADLMIGNSSSGIIEAPSFGLPVVNIGDRQKGRMRGANVLDTPASGPEILEAIRRAADPGTRRVLEGMSNPYGDGFASHTIVEALGRLTPMLLADRSRKVFHDKSTTH